MPSEVFRPGKKKTKKKAEKSKAKIMEEALGSSV
jgi:hypothetical protein